MRNETGANSSENSDVNPLILLYGRPDSLRQRFTRWWPRLRRRTCILLLITIVLLICLFHELPVWKSHSLTQGRSDRFMFESLATAVVPGDRRVVRASGFPEFEILDLADGYRLFDTQITDGRDLQMFFSKDGRRLVTRGMGNNIVRLYDLNHLTALNTNMFRAKQGYGQHECELSDDGTRLLLWTDTGVFLWDAESGKQLAALQNNDEPSVQDVRPTADQRFAVILRPDKADFYQLKDGTYDHSCLLPGSFEQIISRDGSTITVAGLDDGKLHVLNANTGKERLALIPIGKQIIQLEFARDDRHVIAAGGGKMILVDLANGQIIQTTPTPWPAGFMFTLSPDHHWLIFRGPTPTGMIIFIYDTQVLKQVAVIHGKYSIPSRPFSPDGQRFVCVDNGEAGATVWSTATWKPISQLRTGSGEDVWYLKNGTILKAGPYGELNVWSRRRPEAWYGVLCLPIFWPALVAVILALTSVVKDVWRWHHPRPT